MSRVYSWTQVSAGGFHTLVLRQSTPSVWACGRNTEGQCNVPAPPGENRSCSQVSAGRLHSVLLLSDGTAVAFGSNDELQCSIPPLYDGHQYTQISAGYWHTLLLRSDGGADACGLNDDGQCDIPALEEGFIYTHVSAGAFHSLLIRSDGSAVAFGSPHHGACNLPTLEEGLSYVPCELSTGDFVVQLSIKPADREFQVTARGFNGDVITTLLVPNADKYEAVHLHMRNALEPTCRKLRLISPGGDVILSSQNWLELENMEPEHWQYPSPTSLVTLPGETSPASSSDGTSPSF